MSETLIEDWPFPMFKLEERLLKLGIIWRWKAHKGQAYEEEMATFETLKQRLVKQDAGAKALVVGRKRLTLDADLAYPVPISA